MKRKKKINNNKGVEIIRVDKELDKYLEMGLFKEKIEEAERIIKIAGLPKKK